MWQGLLPKAVRSSRVVAETRLRWAVEVKAGREAEALPLGGASRPCA